MFENCFPFYQKQWKPDLDLARPLDLHHIFKIEILQTEAFI